MEHALEVRDLTVTRGKRFHLGPLSLTVQQGQVLCVAGPNGSGKTTLLSALLGMVPIAGGKVDLLGASVDFHLRRHLSCLGYIPDDPDLLLEELTAIEYWRFLARTRDAPDEHAVLDRASELSRALELDTGTLMIRAFSHGMRKKTQIVAALMHQPAVIIVDELRNGLDPIAARMAETLLFDSLERGAGMLASTHDLFWAERHADEVLFLNHGKPIAPSGPPAALQQPADATLEDSFLRLLGRSP